MKEEKVLVITDREELYEKCENMEQLFSNYYLPQLEVHYRKTYNLQQENKQLKEKLNFDLQWALKYDELFFENKQLKDRIEKAVEYIEEHRYCNFGHIDDGEASELYEILKGDNNENNY